MTEDLGRDKSRPYRCCVEAWGRGVAEPQNIMQDARIAAPPPPPAMHAIDLRQRLWGTINAFAESCEMKFQGRSRISRNPGNRRGFDQGLGGPVLCGRRCLDWMDRMDRMDGRRTKPSGVGARFIAPVVFVSLRRCVTRLGLSTRALDAKETLSLQ